jgi:hypothetical protein
MLDGQDSLVVSKPSHVTMAKGNGFAMLKVIQIGIRET